MSGPRESRFKVAAKYQVRVVIERPEGCTPPVVIGEFADISCGGAKVRLSTPVQFGEAVLLRAEDATLDLRLSISADVSWIRKHNEEWVLGCTFDPPLPDAVLEDLFTKGLLERRRAPRKEMRVPICARWECNPSGVPSDVELVDLSPGGFCLRSALPAVIGSRMRLLAKEYAGRPAEVGAKVRWQLEEQDAFLIGCEFDGISGAARLHDWVTRQDSPRLAPKGHSRLAKLRARLGEFRRRPGTFLRAWLGLNEHDKIMQGTTADKAAPVPEETTV